MLKAWTAVRFFENSTWILESGTAVQLFKIWKTLLDLTRHKLFCETKKCKGFMTSISQVTVCAWVDQRGVITARAAILRHQVVMTQTQQKYFSRQSVLHQGTCSASSYSSKWNLPHLIMYLVTDAKDQHVLQHFQKRHTTPAMMWHGSKNFQQTSCTCV